MSNYSYDIRFKKKLNAMLETIKLYPKSQDEIAIEMGLSKTAVRLYIKYAREHNLMFIAGYRPSSNGSKPIFLYQAGSDDDLPYQRKTYTPKKAFIEYVVPRVAKPDEAAAWMFNPIPKEEE
jgi:hypothetical protein